jgi:hypothetical protein
MPAASPSRTAPVQSPRNLGNSPAARPGSSGGSGSRSDLSPSSPNAAAQTLAGSAPTRAQPLILRGPDRSGETANRTGASPFNHAPSLSSQIVRGNSQDASSQPMSQTSATSTEFRPKWPTASAPANPSRPEAAQQMRPFTTPATDVQSPAKSSWPTPRPGAFSAVGERPSQPAAPAVAMPTTPSRAQPFVASTQFGASPSQSWSGRGSR